MATQEGATLQSGVPLVRIGTRGSALALYQARLVRRLLSVAQGVDEAEIEIVVITTSGDRLKEAPLSEYGGKGLFTREIETALFEGRIDVGVHSCKDVATVLPDGLVLGAILEREDVRDAFVSLSAPDLGGLARGALFGTSSIRRAAQMLRQRPDLRVIPFRGNVDTRLRKIGDGVAAATLLAVAGLRRLERTDAITAVLDPELFPPAPAQGAIALEIRSTDTRTANLVVGLDHRASALAVRAERAMLHTIEGSCRTPVGVYSRLEGGTLLMRGELLSPDGTAHVSARTEGPPERAEATGADLGARLLALAGPSLLSGGSI